MENHGIDAVLLAEGPSFHDLLLGEIVLEQRGDVDQVPGLPPQISRLTLIFPIVPVGSVAFDDGATGAGETAPSWRASVFLEAHDKRGRQSGRRRFLQKTSAIGFSVHQKACSSNEWPMQPQHSATRATVPNNRARL
jgi:hypothetical protein